MISLSQDVPEPFFLFNLETMSASLTFHAMICIWESTDSHQAGYSSGTSPLIILTAARKLSESRIGR
jgi:hypothetical protein